MLYENISDEDKLYVGWKYFRWGRVICCMKILHMGTSYVLYSNISDEDECSASSSICANGFCENFMGGYQCTCNEGFRQNSQKTACLG